MVLISEMRLDRKSPQKLLTGKLSGVRKAHNQNQTLSTTFKIKSWLWKAGPKGKEQTKSHVFCQGWNCFNSCSFGVRVWPHSDGKKNLFTFPREGQSRRNILYHVLYSSWARGNKLSYSGMPHREPPFHFRVLRLMRNKPTEVRLQR